MFKKIFMPVDGTENSEKVVNYVKELAKKFDSEIIIFNAQLPIQNVIFTTNSSIFASTYYTPEEIAQKIVDTVSKQFDSSFKVRTDIVIGDPASTILEFSEKHKADCIVICTHGLNATKRFLLGSVTNKVVNYAKIPVLVIR